MKQSLLKIKLSCIQVTKAFSIFCFLVLLSFSFKAKAAGCQADFTYDYDSNPQTILFTDLSYGSITNWYWQFGDGGSSTKQNPLYTYSKAGDYMVFLVVGDGAGCKDTAYYSIHVDAPAGCGIIADFNFDVDLKKSATFYDKSYSPTGVIDTYIWDFGDGSPASYETNPVHQYAADGDYSVTCTVADSKLSNCYDSKVIVVKVGNGVPQCNLYPYFTSLKDSSNDQVINFNNGSDKSAVKFSWDFGDDSYSSVENPTHEYREPGGYYVMLTVSNADGSCKDYMYEFIQVGSGGCLVDPYFSVETSGNTVLFNDYSYGPVTDYYWDFGDGSYSKEKSPKHTYKDGGYFVSLTVFDANTPGCQNSYSNYVEVGSGGCKTSSYFQFLVEPDSNRVSFSDQSYGSVTGYYWDFGDGTYSSEVNPSHKYEKAGGYYVNLTVSDSTIAGCQNSYYAYVAVGDGGCRTSAYFTSVPDSASNLVKFTDNSFGNVTHYFWDFGTGDVSKEMHPVYEFPKAGGYYVSLTVSDTTVDGCQNTYWSYVQAGSGGCNAGAYFSAAPNTTDNTVRFTDKSYGKINAWYWDFGNGDYSNQQNPKYTYKESGGYYVSLTVSDTSINGCQNTYWEYVSVGNGGCMSYPYFSYLADGNKVSFSDNSFGTTTSWHWDFGNGNYSIEQNPEYTYKTDGYYNVCLTIRDSSSGCQNSYCDYIKIGQATSCQANFVSRPSLTSNAVAFSDKSEGVSDSWYWDFGDGNYSMEQNPKYEYKKAGYYAVCLYTYNTATDCGSSYCDFIKVGTQADCQAKFSAMPDNLTVAFADQSLGAPDSWYWDFGNGDYSYDANPKYTYQRPGFYTVTLSIWNSSTNCVSDYNSTIQVGQADCKASFKYFIDPVTKKAEFSNTSFGNTSEVYWDFGNGDYSTASDPTYTFSSQGYYQVCLYTYDKTTECMSSYCEEIRAGDGACAARFSSKSAENSNKVLFNDESRGSATEWSWNFGDGNTSSLQNPDYTYKRGGYYAVCLTTYDKVSGCMDSYCDFIHVGASECKASFNFYTDPATNKVALKDASYGNPSNYYWDFGDGRYSTEKNPEHGYTYEGIYTVCLYTYDSISACSDYICQDIKAGNGGSDCEAKFETFTKDQTLSAKDISTDKADYWFYDFGDGDYSLDQNPTHTYSEDGYYSVCLTTYNSANGCVSTNCNNVSIGAAATTDCAAKFSFVADPVTKNVIFKDESYGELVSWEWKFDSTGATSAVSNPEHNFGKDGVYPVYLTIRTAGGCTKTYGDVVSIGQEGLFANFMYEKDSAIFTFKNEVTYPVSFYGSAYGKPSKWKWAFGDNSYDTLRVNPIHYYQAAGSYNACLTISDPVAKLSSVKCSQVKVGGAVTGTQNDKTIVGLAVFPNPTTSASTVSYTLTQSSAIQLSLIDMQGKKVQTVICEYQNAGVYRQTIDIADLKIADGMYLVNLSINNKAYNIPLMIKK